VQGLESKRLPSIGHRFDFCRGRQCPPSRREGFALLGAAHGTPAGSPRSRHGARHHRSDRRPFMAGAGPAAGTAAAAAERLAHLVRRRAGGRRGVGVATGRPSTSIRRSSARTGKACCSHGRRRACGVPGSGAASPRADASALRGACRCPRRLGPGLRRVRGPADAAGRRREKGGPAWVVRRGVKRVARPCLQLESCAVIESLPRWLQPPAGLPCPLISRRRRAAHRGRGGALEDEKGHVERVGGRRGHARVHGGLRGTGGGG